MWKCATACLIVLSAYGQAVRALEPNEILVVANTDNAASVRLARYYCEKRGIPSNRRDPGVPGDAAARYDRPGGLRPVCWPAPFAGSSCPARTSGPSSA